MESRWQAGNNRLGLTGYFFDRKPFSRYFFSCIPKTVPLPQNPIRVHLQKNTLPKRLQHCVSSAFPKGMKTAWWLIKITVPVSFGVMLLDYFGILSLMAHYTGTVFRHFGLPGVSAIVLVTSIFTNIYSVVAVLSLLHLPLRE